ncbi:MAG: hypothetical protein JWR80_5668 [Bradyrhizobium sp.]|nr:hypothetical protein [Bradyrhizobium sp.]
MNTASLDVPRHLLTFEYARGLEALLPIALLFGAVIAGGTALAQDAVDPMAQLRACSAMMANDRLQCLERLSRNIAPPPGPASPSGDNNWILSDTFSPVDYSPLASATTRSHGSDGSLQLSIRCRGGRTEFAVIGPALGRGADYLISYRLNDDPPVQVAAATPSSGTGAAFTSDVVRLLQSLPEEGELSVRLSPRTGNPLEGRFGLGGLRPVREKIAAACKWPHDVTKR